MNPHAEISQELELHFDAELKKMMQRAAQRVQETAAHLRCSLRQAAYAAALEHIQRVYHIRGIFP